MDETTGKTPGRTRDFEALERAYRSAGEWKKLAELYENSVRHTADQKVAMQRLLQAGVLLRDKLKSPEKAKGCFDQSISILTAWISTATSAIEQSDFLCDLAKVYLEVIRDREKAIEVYVRAFELDPQKTYLMSVLGDIYSNQEGWPDVISRFGADAKAAENTEAKAKYLEEIADIFAFILDDPEKAIEKYKEILSIHPKSNKAMEGLENLLIKTRRWEELTALYDKTKEQTTDKDELISIYTKLGLIYKDKLRTPFQAVQIYREILALQPDNFRIKAKLEELRSDPEIWNSAIADLGKHLRPDSFAADRARISLQQSLIADEYLHQPNLAMERAAEAFRLCPESPEIVRQAIKLWTRAGAWEKVAHGLEVAAEKIPVAQQRVANYAALADVSIQQLRDPLRAIAALETLLQLSPAEAPARTRLISLYEQQQMWSPLERLLDSTIATTPESERKALLLQLAELREKRLANPTGAIEIFEQLLALDPSDDSALCALERLYTQQRRWKELIENFERRAHLTPSDKGKSTLYLAQAKTLEEKLGDLKGSAVAYQKALPFADLPEPISQRIEQIYFSEKMWSELEGLFKSMLTQPKLVPDPKPILFKLAELYEQKLGQISKAQETLRSILERDRKNLSALTRLARIYEQQEQWEPWLEICQLQMEALSDPREKASVCMKAGEVSLTRLKDDRRAAGYFRRVIDLDLSNRAALDFLADFYRRENRSEELLKILEAKVGATADPQPLSQLRYEMAHLLEHSLHREEDAIKQYELALNLDPALTHARRALSEIYLRHERWPDLARIRIGELEQTRDRFQGAEIAMKIGEIFLTRLHDPEKAVPYLRRSLELNSSDAAVVRDLIRALEEVGQHEETLLGYQRLVQLSDSPQEKAQVSLRIGALQLKQKKDPAAAAEWYERALTFDPQAKAALSQLIFIYETSENWDGLLKTYERILSKTEGPQGAQLYFRVGELYEKKKGIVDRALVSYQIANELDPNYLPPLTALRRLLRTEENWGEYLKVARAEAALQDSPKTKAELLFETGKLWREKFLQVGRAVAAFEEVLQLLPDDLSTLVELSSLYEEQQSLDSSYRATQKALQQSTDPQQRVSLLERLGRLELDHRRDAAGAAKAFREILSIHPKNREAVNKLAKAYELASDWKGQLSSLQMLLEIEPSVSGRIEALFEIARIWKGPLEARDNAAETLRAVCRLDPGNVRAVQELSEVMPDGKQWQSAADKLIRYLLEKKEPEPLIQAALALSKISHERFKQTGWAIATLTQTTQQIGDHADLLDALIRLYEQSGEALALADAAFRRSKLYRDPDERAQALVRVAQTWAEALDNPRQAIEALEEARRIHPSSLDIADQLVSLYSRTQDYKAADRLLSEVISKESLTSGRIQDLALKRASILSDARNSPNEALAIYQEILKVAPDHRGALQATLTILERNGDWPNLAKSLEQLAVLVHGSERNEARQKLAQIFEERLGDLGKATEQHERVLRTLPQDRSTLASLQRLYEKQKDYAALVRSIQLQLAASTDPEETSQLFRKLGEVWQKHLKDEARALDAYERSLEGNPTQLDLIEFLSKKYRAAKRYVDLLEVLRKKTALVPPGEVISVYEELSDLSLKSLNNPIAALEFLNAVLKLNPGHRPALLKIAAIHRQNENHWELVRTLKSLAETAPTAAEKAETWLSVADLQADRLGARAEAIESYRRVLTLEPSHVKALDRLRNLFGREERWKDLADVLRSIAKGIEPAQSVSILKELAKIEVDRLHRMDAAIATLEQLQKLGADDPSIPAELAVLYERHGKYPQLAALLEHELKGTPSVDRTLALLRRLGELYDDRLHKSERSIPYLERLLEKVPGDIPALSRLETLYRKVGRAEEADRVLEQKAEHLSFGPERTALLDSLADLYWAQLGRAEDAIRCYKLVAKDPAERRHSFERLASIYESLDSPKELSQVLHSLIQEMGESEEVIPRLLQLGTLEHVRLKNPKKAEAAFGKALELSPHHLDAIAALKTLYQETQEWEKAVNLLKREIAGAREPLQKGTMLRELAEIWRGPLQNADQAIPLYEELVRITPHEVQAVTILAELYFEKGKWKESAPLFDRLVKISASRKDPVKGASLFYRRGAISRKLGQTEEAIIYLNQSLSYDPNHSDSIRALADLFYELGQWDNALRMLRRVIELGRPEDQAHIDQHYFRLLQTLERLQKEDEAVELFERAQDQLKNHLGGLKLAADLYLKRHVWEKARDLFDRILKQAKLPNDRQNAAFALAELSLLRFRQPEQARKYFSNLFQIDPHHKAGLELFLVLCEEQKDWPDAIAVLGQLTQLETDPEKLSQLHFRLGKIHDQETGDLKKARECYLKAIEISQGETPAMAALEAFCTAEKDWRDLAAVYTKTSSKLKSSGKLKAASNFQLALGLLQLNQLRDASAGISALQEADALDPESESVLTHLARTLALHKSRTEAEGAYARLLSLYPDRPAVLRELAHFYEKVGKSKLTQLFRSCLAALDAATPAEKNSIEGGKPAVERSKAPLDLEKTAELLPAELSTPWGLLFREIGESLIPVLTSGDRSKALLSATEVIPEQTRQMIFEFSKRLGIDPKSISTYFSTQIRDVELELVTPPAMGVGPGLFKLEDEVQRFLIAYPLAALKLGFRILAHLSHDAAEELLEALSILATDRPPRKEGSQTMAEAIKQTLSRRDLKAVSTYLAAEEGMKVRELSTQKLISGFDRAALRIAFLLVDHPLGALKGAKHLHPEKLRELITFATSKTYIDWLLKLPS